MLLRFTQVFVLTWVIMNSRDPIFLPWGNICTLTCTLMTRLHKTCPFLWSHVSKNKQTWPTNVICVLIQSFSLTEIEGKPFSGHHGLLNHEKLLSHLLASNRLTQRSRDIFYSVRLTSGTGGVDLHSDLVGVGCRDGLHPSRGGTWQRHEGVLQEAGVPAQHSHLPADWPAHTRRPSEGHDHLHHRRPRQRRGGQDDHSEGGAAAFLGGWVRAATVVTCWSVWLSCSRWRMLRPSCGSPSWGIAGMRGKNTVLPTFAMRSSSTPTNTWATRHAWSSLLSQTGTNSSCFASQSVVIRVLFSCQTGKTVPVNHELPGQLSLTHHVW